MESMDYQRKIAICDDEPAQVRLLSGLVKRWAAERTASKMLPQIGQPVQVETFPSAEAFQFAWAGDRSYFVVLLDIQMEGLSGIELARQLRRESEDLAIIFITGIPDYIGEGYDIAALHYLLKPVQEDRLFACLDRAVRREKNEPVLLLADSEGETVRVLQREIQYIEAFAHTVEVHTGQAVIEARIGLNALEQELEPGWFVRSHRSYLVGLQYIARLGRAELYLDSGVAVPISRRLFGTVNSEFVRYYRGLEREGNLE